MKTFKLKILTPDTKLFDGEVLQVVLPTKSGEITVLPDHIPMISLLSIGEIKIKTESEEKNFLVQGGVIDIKKNENSFEVIILADQKIDHENINLEELNQSIDRAKVAMQEKSEGFDEETFESQVERGNYFRKLKG